MVTQSDNHGYDIPTVDDDADKWGDYLNNTLKALDVDVVLKDTLSNRPSADSAGRWFLATDTLELFYDNGNAWDMLAYTQTDTAETVTAEWTFEAGIIVDGDVKTGPSQGDITIYDSANDQPIATFSEGGNVAINNGDLRFAGGDMKFTGSYQNIDQLYALNMRNTNMAAGNEWRRYATSSGDLTLKWYDGAVNDRITFTPGGETVFATDLQVNADVYCDRFRDIQHIYAASSSDFPKFYTSGSGSGNWIFDDLANGQEIARFSEGGAVTVPNGPLSNQGSPVLTEADEGTGNGIDADTVDGYDGADLGALAESETVTSPWTFDSETTVSDIDQSSSHMDEARGMQVPPATGENQAWMGDQNDSLAYVNEWGTVSFGQPIDGGAEYMAFMPFTGNWFGWDNSTDTTYPVQMTMDISNYKDWGPKVFGITFSNDARAGDITIETSSDGGSTWTTEETLTDQSNNWVRIDANSWSTPVEQIRLTFANPADGQNIRIERFYKFTTGGNMTIGPWAPIRDADFYSSLTLNSGDLIDGAGNAIYDQSNQWLPQSRLEADSLTVASGNGLKNGGTVSLGASTTLDVEPATVAGNGIEDDGADNFQVDTSAVAGQGIQDDGTELRVADRIQYAPGHTEWTTDPSNEEVARFIGQSGEAYTIEEIQFPQKGGGSSTSASIDVYDVDAANLLISANLGELKSADVTAGAGNTIITRLTNDTGSAIEAAPVVDGFRL